MDKNYLIKLTSNLYRLTLLFPKKEPLRYKMRELADNTLANIALILEGSFHRSKDLFLEAEKDLEVLDDFFEVAKNQNWVSPENILSLQEEYRALERFTYSRKTKGEIGKPDQGGILISLPEREVALGQNYRSQVSVNERQQRILGILKEKGKIQVWEVQKVFPEVTKRTLRRDLESLFKKSIIERIGKSNQTFYKLNSGQIS